MGSPKADFPVFDLDELDGIHGMMKNFDFSRKQFTVAVEGNIGCGKTTLLNYFENFSEAVQVVKEPVELWTNIRGHNGLQHMYENPSRWTYMFNHYSCLTRAGMHTGPVKAPVRMLERSLFSMRYMFVENALKRGDLSEVEYRVLDKWFQTVISTYNIKVDLFGMITRVNPTLPAETKILRQIFYEFVVYLRASPEVCYERIKVRDRKEEASVPFDFIKDLHDLHENWLMIDGPSRPGPVLVLDASQDLEGMKDLYVEHKSQILHGHS